MNADEQNPRSAIVEHVETIPNPAKGGYANPASLKLWSKPSHMNVDRLGFADKARAPGARKDPVSTQDRALVLNQDSEEVEFARCHLELAAFDLRAPSSGIEP